MSSHPWRLWGRLREQLWFKPAWWSVVATFVALAAVLANGVLPDGVLPDVERQTLQGLLTIIASSMLTVSTFSLSILVQAFSSAAGSATPRALRVIMGDDNAQTAVATFIAAFIYAVIALLALGLGYYGSTGRFVLLLVTIAVVVQVIVMLIRWIRTLSQLGRMGHTVQQVEAAASAALRDHWRDPALGGRALETVHGLPGMPLRAVATGYVQHLDVPAMQTQAQAQQWEIRLVLRPGAFVVRGQVLAMVADAQGRAAVLAPEQEAALRRAIEVGAERSFLQDPRFGLLVLSEIGQRALSAAVNDAGSAIQVGGSITRVLVDAWAQHRAGPPSDPPSADRCDRVYVPALDDADFVRDAFAPLQRDAAGLVEVHTRFTKLLGAIAGATGGVLAEEARRLAWRGWLLAREQTVLEEERDALQRLARQASGRAAQ
ncbi:DUF2254 domain-containing protein [Pseudorhodoferax sp. Leaf274]|uniref:DUF2254 domain-containing protein n=1 Tax=Pseudorhodoferax sp. Leaf274 TaxID=1736318 RepID=UPI0007038E9C|nr:DUF2254 domain-containing protein [Pseudorhodoferax sp. Leaf274]KQP35712.1 hypothetical protein ASF44_20575 [Pseudorhodoferax sp. Leaf274]